jgi:hypothetical protein
VWATSALPLKRAVFFPGARLEPPRAGITAMVGVFDMKFSLRIDLLWPI